MATLMPLVAFARPYEPIGQPVSSCLTNEPIRITQRGSFNRWSGPLVLSLQAEKQRKDLGTHLDARIVLEHPDEPWDDVGCTKLGSLARVASQRVQRHVAHEVNWVG